MNRHQTESNATHCNALQPKDHLWASLISNVKFLAKCSANWTNAYMAGLALSRWTSQTDHLACIMDHANAWQRIRQFSATEMPANLDESIHAGLGFVAPDVPPLRPPHPDLLVLLPLRRHEEALPIDGVPKLVHGW